MLPQIQVLEDLSDDGPLFNEGNDLHLASAAGTGQGIGRADLLQKSRPVAASLPGIVLGGRVRPGGAVEFSRLGCRETLVTSFTARGVGIAAVVTNHLLVRIGEVSRAIQSKASRQRVSPLLVRYWICPVWAWYWSRVLAKLGRRI